MNQTYTVTFDEDGTRYWRQNGQLHRTDGPAVEYAHGAREWWLNGQRHRADGPAVEYASGARAWWINGQLHRWNGPAVEWADGDREWFLNGVQLTEEEWLRRRWPRAILPPVRAVLWKSMASNTA